jgi:uncharacterized protein YbcI
VSLTTFDQISDGAQAANGAAAAIADAEAPSGSRSPMLEIANAMVRLYKEAFGRGPTKARAVLAGPDTLVVTLENSLTVAERNLVALGQTERLRTTRLFFLQSLEPEFRAIVEGALGRRTLAFVSGIDPSRDVAAEVFTLEPVGAPSLDSEP